LNLEHNNKTFSISPYLESDLESFIELFMDVELCQYMNGGAFDKESDAEIFFYHLLELNNSTNCTIFGIYEKETHIGHFELQKNSFTKTNEIEIVYLLKKEYWGKGIMATIIKAFQKLEKNIFVARIEPNNFNSIKMLEKIGIKKQTITNFNNRKVIKITLNNIKTI